MLRIRFFRTGRKGQPFYKIVVTDKNNPPASGRIKESVGFYNPLTKECKIESEKVLAWIGKGAQPSDVVHNLLIKKGVIKGKKSNVVFLSEKKKAKIKEVTKNKQKEAEAKEVKKEKEEELTEEVKTEEPTEEVKTEEPIEEVKIEEPTEGIKPEKEVIEQKSIKEKVNQIKEEETKVNPENVKT